MNLSNRIFKRTSQNFNNIGIFPRTFLSFFILLVLTVFIICIVVFFKSRASVTDSNRKSFMQVLHSIKNNINTYRINVNDEELSVSEFLSNSDISNTSIDKQSTSNSIKTHLKMLLKDYEATLYIVDSNGLEILTVHNAPNSSDYTFPLPYEIVKKEFLEEGNKIIKDSFRGELLYSYTDLGIPGFSLILVTPLKQFLSTLDDIWTWICLMLIIFVALLIIVSIILIRSITNPVKQIIYSMRNPVLNVDLSELALRKDEIGNLAAAYIKRIEDVNNLLSIIEESNNKKHLVQIEALQGQINYHFIYNTLNNIQWLAQSNRTDDVIETVSALDKLLRACAHNSNDLITIEDELSYVESYLKAQKIRFGSMFTFEFDIDVLLLQMKIPKFVLQPIVENAIYHGLMNSNKEIGKIRIELNRRGHRIDIKVYDNGVGITEDKIYNVLSNEHKSTGKSMGLALGNIDKRVRLLFGRDYGLGINSKPGAYTVVELTIPVVL